MAKRYGFVRDKDDLVERQIPQAGDMVYVKETRDA